MSSYHSDPLITKLMLPFGTFKGGNPYAHLTRAEITQGALKSASNPERTAFFAHAWVLTGNIAGFLFAVGVILMIVGISLNPSEFNVPTIVMFSIPLIVSCAITGLSLKFYSKKRETEDTNTTELVTFTNQELVRPIILGALFGICSIAFLYGGASYAFANPVRLSCDFGKRNNC